MKVFSEYECEYKSLRSGPNQDVGKKVSTVEEDFFSDMWGQNISDSSIENEMEAYLGSGVVRRERAQSSDWVLSWWKVYSTISF